MHLFKKVLTVATLVLSFSFSHTAFAFDSWTSITPPATTGFTFTTITSSDNYVYLGTDHGVYKSANQGVTWTQINTGLTNLHVNSIVIAGGSTYLTDTLNGYYTVNITAPVFVGTDAGVFKGTLGGSTWTAVNTGLSDTHINSIEFDTYSWSSIYVATPSGIFRSDNAGQTWSLKNTGMVGVSVKKLASAGSSDGAMYALSTNNTIYTTGNLGTYSYSGIDETWSLLYTGGATTTQDISAPHATGYALWNATSKGVVVYDMIGLYSVNSTSWVTVSEGLPLASVSNLESDYFDLSIAYTSIPGYGIYKTINQGLDRWQKINTGLTDLTVNQVITNPASSTIAYAKSPTGGVYKLSLSDPYADMTPPTAVTDLIAYPRYTTTNTNDSVSLQWTAPYDTSYSWDHASYYDIRYAPLYSTLSTNWNSAQSVFDSINHPTTTAIDGGFLDGYTIDYLSNPSQSYCYALKTIDEVYKYNASGVQYAVPVNTSPISNIVCEETTPPVVTAFTIPTTASALTVPITTFTATDVGGSVVGYLLTETPTAPLPSIDDSDPNWNGLYWTVTPPTTYTFTSNGVKTLYAWAKDSAGNVSLGISRSITVNENLTPTITSFTIPVSASSLTVDVTSFIASPYIAGYLLTESATAPPATDPAWSVVPPATYTFTTSGTKTLYAWAKNNTGVVSSGVSRTVLVTLPVLDAWTTITPSGTTGYAYSALASMDNYVFLGTDHGVYKSSDYGATWTLFNTGLTNLHVNAIAIGWGRAGAGNIVTPSSLIFVGTDAGLFETSFAGTFWVPANSGLTDTHITSIEFDKNAQMYGPDVSIENFNASLYAGTPSGVFTSTDLGQSWVLSNVGIAGVPIAKVVSGALEQTLYAMSTTNKVYTIGSDPLVVQSPSTPWSLVFDGKGTTTQDVSASYTFSYALLSTSKGVLPYDPSWLVFPPVFVNQDPNNTDTYVPFINQGLPTASVSNVESDYFNQDVAYASIPGYGVYKILNLTQGMIDTPLWQSANAGLTDLNINKVVTDPVSSTLVYAKSSTGIYRLVLSDQGGGASSDTIKPSVTTFIIPSTATSFTVPVTSFDATDVGGVVAGYLLTESAVAPSASDSGWTTSAPTAYIFNSAGSKTLYAWVKDDSDNVSTGVSRTVTVAPTDTTKPVITAFTVSSVTPSLTITISALTATDTGGIGAYVVSESSVAPLTNDTRWSVTVPTTYTFDTLGNKTLYAWVKDTTGNVSQSVSQSVLISLSPFSGFNSASLSAFYNFDEVNTSESPDRTGNNNVGYPIGGVSRTVGRTGGGLSFDGVDAEFLLSNSNLNIDPTLTSHSVSMWVKVATLSEVYKIFDRATDFGAIAFNGAPKGSVCVNQWCHLTFTGTASSHYLYINGQSDAFISKVFSTRTFGTIVIGAPDNPFVGSIDDVKVFSRSLTPLEVTTLYSFELSNTPPSVSLSASPTSAVAPATLSLTASASDSDGTVSSVAFYNGATLLTTDTTAPYSYSWTSVPVGTYSLTAKATDNSGAVTTSAVSTVSVTATPDTTRPTITSFTIPTTASSLTITISSFIATDNNAVTGYLLTESATAPLAGASGWTSTAPTTYTFTTAGSKTLYAWAKDGAGNVSLGTSQATITVTLPDTTSPTVPTNLVSSSITQTTLTLSWTASTDPVVAGQITSGVSKYNVYRGTTLIGSPTGTTLAVTGLTANTAYTFSVEAVDATTPTPNISATRVSLSVTTLPAVNVPPTVTLSASPTNASAPATITLTASASDSDGTVSSVAFYNGATLLATDTTAPYTYSWTSVPVGTYSLTAKATDNSSAVTTSSATSVTVADNTAPTISAFTIPATASSVTISITSFTATDVGGTVTGYLLTESPTAPLSTATGWTSTAPTTYTFTSAGSKTLYAWAKDSAGNVSLGTSRTIAISLPDVTAPTVPTNFTSSSITQTTLTLSWTASTDPVVAGQTTSGVSKYNVYRGTTLIGSPTGTTLAVTGLTAGTVYTFSIESVDATLPTPNISATRASLSVTTLSPANVAPTVTFTVSPTSATTPATFTLGATASDSDGTVSSVAFYNGATLLATDTTAPYTYIWASVLSGTYSLTARATDNVGAVTTSNSIAVTVIPTADITAPTTPTSLATSSVGGTTVTLSWTASIDPVVVEQTNSGIAGYRVYRDSAFIGTSVTNSYSDSGLTSSTTYVYKVASYDGAGNFSASSSALSVTTATVDVTLPTITSFSIPSTATSLTISISSFSASDNVGVTGYLLTESASTPSPSLGSWSSTPPTTYTFSTSGTKILYAWTKDLAGNVSLASNAGITITTSSGSGGGGGGGGGGGSKPPVTTITPVVTPLPTVSSPFTQTLSLGVTSPEVLLLQQYLNQQGYTISLTGIGSTGNESTYFGDKTRLALIRYQVANSLPPTGQVDATTLAHLKTKVTSSSLTKAQLIAQLIAQIAYLQSEIQKILAQRAQTSVVTPPCCKTVSLPSSYTTQIADLETKLNTLRSSVSIPLFTRSLSVGMTGDDVTRLRTLLSSEGFTTTDSSSDSSTFTTNLKTALAKFQEYHRDTILAPNNFLRGEGGFGPSTRQAINDMITIQALPQDKATLMQSYVNQQNALKLKALGK